MPSKINESDYFSNYAGSNLSYEKSYQSFGLDPHKLILAFQKARLEVHTILDVGCARGLTIEDLRNFGFEAFGIELFQTEINRASPEIRPFIAQMDMRAVDHFPKNSFDVAYINSAMYLNEKEINKFLRKIRKPIEKGIYIMNPYTDDPETIPDDKHRLTLKNKRWWIETLKQHGWKYVRGTDFYFFLKVPLSPSL